MIRINGKEKKRRRLEMKWQEKGRIEMKGKREGVEKIRN